MEKVVGVLGGMGPQATVDFFQKVINCTRANRDQEHIHLIIENNPKIPDRTSYILGEGESPLKHLVSSALKLQFMGADILAMPCNTAHYFYDDIIRYIDIPFINMIEEVAREIYEKYRKGSRIGLLATTGTYKGGMYSRYLNEYGIEMLEPSWEDKKVIYHTIYMIKKGLHGIDTEGINRVILKLKKEGVSAVILGCTELPLIMHLFPPGIDYIDSTCVLAKRTVELAKNM